MNEFSYNFNLFTEPSETAPWGWSLYGHHVCVNIMVIGKQMVASPVFLGVEPNFIDEGPQAGTRLFHEPDSLTLDLLRGLPESIRDAVVLYSDKRDPLIPPGREVFGHELHLGAMFRTTASSPTKEPAPVASRRTAGNSSANSPQPSSMAWRCRYS